MSSETKGFTKVEMGSERGFGFVLAGVFTIIALFPLVGGSSVRLWSLVIAGGCLGFAVLYPKGLRGPNIVWFRFGLLLGKIVTPVVMAVLFVTTVLPTAVIMRALGKDSLRMKHDNSATHWISRSDPGPKKGTMRDQF